MNEKYSPEGPKNVDNTPKPDIPPAQPTFTREPDNWDGDQTIIRDAKEWSAPGEATPPSVAETTPPSAIEATPPTVNMPVQVPQPDPALAPMTQDAATKTTPNWGPVGAPGGQNEKNMTPAVIQNHLAADNQTAPQGQTGFIPPSSTPPAGPPFAPLNSGYGNQFEAPTNPFGATIPPQHRPHRAKRRIWPAVLAAILVFVLAACAALWATGAVTINGFGATEPGKPTQNQSQFKQGETTPRVDTSGTAVDWTKLVSTVGPSVVSLQVQAGGSGGPAGSGSGVIIDNKGDVLTNHHVVGPAVNGGEIAISLSDGRVFDGKIVGTDPATDLAVVRIVNAPSDLVAAPFGDSNQVKVGQPVAAIGSPLGLSSTLTTGIVSALNRPVATLQKDSSPQGAERVVTNAIQIDASINPGNSGGPLFNAKGEVIGINSSIASLSRGENSERQQSGSIGLGFAIPSDLVKRVAAQLIDKGKVDHAFLGVKLSSAIVSNGKTKRVGALLTEITPGSAAARADLKSNDVVVAIDENPVTSGISLTGWVRRYAPGDVVKLTVVRGGKEVPVTVTLGKSAQDG